MTNQWTHTIFFTFCRKPINPYLWANRPLLKNKNLGHPWVSTLKMISWLFICFCNYLWFVLWVLIWFKLKMSFLICFLGGAPTLTPGFSFFSFKARENEFICVNVTVQLESHKYSWNLVFDNFWHSFWQTDRPTDEHLVMEYIQPIYLSSLPILGTPQ